MLSSRCTSNHFVSSLLKFPARVSYRDKEEVKALYEADVEKTCKLLQELKENGTLFEINSRCYKNYTPLEWASMMGDIRKVQCLVELGEAKDTLIEEDEENPKWSALAAAASATQEVVVDYLLSKGARSDLFFQNDQDSVSFILQVVEVFCAYKENKQDVGFYQRQSRCLERILMAHQDLAATQEKLALKAQWPFETALIYGRRDLMEVLAKFGFDWPALNRTSVRDCEFFDAVSGGRFEVVQWFIETYPIPIDLFEEEQGSVFKVCEKNGRSDIAQYLKNRSKNPVILEKSGRALQFYSSLDVSKKAVICLAKYLSTFENFEEFDSMELCCAFLKEEIIDEPVDESGCTLLHLAAQCFNDLEVQDVIIPTLLRKGADRSVKNRKKQTPFDVATNQINHLCPIEQNMRKEVAHLYRAAKVLLPKKKIKKISRSAP